MCKGQTQNVKYTLLKSKVLILLCMQVQLLPGLKTMASGDSNLCLRNKVFEESSRSSNPPTAYINCSVQLIDVESGDLLDRRNLDSKLKDIEVKAFEKDGYYKFSTVKSMTDASKYDLNAIESRIRMLNNKYMNSLFRKDTIGLRKKSAIQPGKNLG